MDDETIFTFFDSLKREMDSQFDSIMRVVRDSLERIETRLTRQGGLIQGGPAKSPASQTGPKKSMK